MAAFDDTVDEARMSMDQIRSDLDTWLGPSYDDLYDNAPPVSGDEGEVKLDLVGSFDFPYLERTPDEAAKFREITRRVARELIDKGEL